MYARKKQYVDMEIEARLGINKWEEKIETKETTPSETPTPQA
jgi:hypothetical protein